MRFTSSSSSSSSLYCLIAAAVTETKMSSFRPYPRRGRNPYRREFCNRPRENSEPFVSGDSHLRSVTDANYGFRQGYGGNFSNFGRFQGQPYRPPPNFRQPPPFHQPRPKPWDYRNWEYALSQAPSHCERFVVLSYNILANYLALDHRRELYYHIPPYILDWEWRRRKIFFELGLWSPDILCLQEVDRFQDLENELKLHGYDGIWKMRTGKPIDGCAIFWRTTRFKLRHEEHIEFRNLGLRDNVAQICVFESGNQNPADNVSDANQVVICNIHVLYNPKRGEIKLGQVRELLNRAHAVSKLWNDAPVVLCGDFNCTPKSPLYNFISEQKLNLVGLARDQISGQSSAEIKTTRPYNPNPGQGLQRAQSPDNSVGTSMLVDEKVDEKRNHIPDVHNQHKPRNDVENSSLTENLVQPPSINEVVGAPQKYGSNGQYKNENTTVSDAMRIEKEEEIIDGSKDEFVSPHYVPLGQIRESPIGYHEEGAPAVDLEKDVVQELTPPLASCNVDIDCLKIESGHGEKSNLESEERTSSLEGNIYCAEAADLVSETSSHADFEVGSPENFGNFSPCPTTDASTFFRSTYEVKISDESTYIDSTVDQKMGNLSLGKQGEGTEEDGSLDQDHGSTFSSERYSTEYVTTIHDDNSLRPESAEADQSSVECTTPQNSELPPPSAEVDASSPSIDSEPANMARYVYDPYLWTPMEIETASGNADCTLLEHPLKLKSTYADVEDYSGTRDPESREPQVTSYNSRFLGTVDYIWCSEGLQTVKVLDTLPKQALQQWTTGFPTKKWGSDHIALASQLAFKKDVDRK